MSRHTYECRVRFSDVDIYGHVNNVKYFEYYQEARIVFLTSLGQGEAGDRFNVVLARVDVDYKRPIVFRTEPFAIESRVTRVGGSSFELTAEIKDGDTVLSRAEAVLVTFDTESQRSRPLSDVERDLLTATLDS